MIIQSKKESGKQLSKAFMARGFAYLAVAQESKNKDGFGLSTTDFSEAIRLDPENYEAFYGRAQAHQNTDALHKALADYSSALRIKPNIAEAYLNRSGVYYRLNQVDRGLADLDQAIRLNPAYARAYHNRCYARTLLGRELQMALADCNKALEFRPQNANTLEARGLVYYLLGRYEDALQDADASFKNSRRSQSLYLRGLARQKLGLITEGKLDVERALAIQPSLAVTLGEIGIK